jgi:hypothetical protein
MKYTPRSIRPPLALLVVASGLLVACLAPVRVSQSRDAVLVGSLADARVVADQRLVLEQIARDRVASARISDRRWAMGPVGQSATTTSDDARELVSLLVACALPEGDVLTATLDGSPIDFFGEVGLAPDWVRRPLGRVDRQWVSACVMARLSGTDLASAISLRGCHPALAAVEDERDAWSFEEGAFFGDVFADPSRPLPWFACRGTGPAGDVALEERVCTVSDPDRPGRTRCGMVDAGSCDAACERGPDGYRDCRSPDPGSSYRPITAFLVP